MTARSRDFRRWSPAQQVTTSEKDMKAADARASHFIAEHLGGQSGVF